MKCPYRTVTSYTKEIGVYAETKQADGRYVREMIETKIVPCAEAEAHFKTIDFAECLKSACQYYLTSGSYNIRCSKVRAETPGFKR